MLGEVAATGADGIAEIQIEGEEALLAIELRAGRARFMEETSAPPDCALIASAEDWDDLLEDRATLQAMLIDRRVVLEGDVAVALRAVEALGLALLARSRP